MLNAGIDAHREGCLIGIGVAIHHQRQIQLIEALPLHRQADQPPRFGGHEVDGFRCGELGRTDQVTLVLPLFVIHHNDAGSIADINQGIGNGIEADRILRSGRSAGVQCLNP